MLDNKEIIAFIPMRGGSRSIKNKNLRLLGEKPLLAWPIDVAKQTKLIDRVIVSTDDIAIAEQSMQRGSEVYMRPEELATDHAVVADVIRYMRSILNAESVRERIMVLLEATSPFRTVEMIEQCVHDLMSKKLDSVATFQEASLNPHRSWQINANGKPSAFLEGIDPWLPRQLLPKAYELNGLVYVFSLDRFPEKGNKVLFGKSGAIISHHGGIDIDTEEDLIIANALCDAKTIASA